MKVELIFLLIILFLLKLNYDYQLKKSIFWAIVSTLFTFYVLGVAFCIVMFVICLFDPGISLLAKILGGAAIACCFGGGVVIFINDLICSISVRKVKKK